MKKIILSVIFAFVSLIVADACTSAIVSGDLTRSGRPIVWKNRDTGVEDNFICQSISPEGMRYIGLYNAGDSLLRDAWAGFNEAGFVIMNTASYNLAPDTTDFVDQEGYVMRRALSVCRTLTDFETLLDTIAKPMGVQANFGVMDSKGNGAYYETDDYHYKKYGLTDSSCRFIIRTNYSYSGTEGGGYGYIRENNARSLMRPYVESKSITPEVFTDLLSRSFYHSLFDRDLCVSATDSWIIDQDFIPRYTSTASVAFELPRPDEPAGAVVMWVALGYPPCSYVKAVTIDNVPKELQPNAEWHSPFCDEVVARKYEVFPIRRGSGPHYINVKTLRRYNEEMRRLSRQTYSNYDVIRKSLLKSLGK